MCLNGMSIGQRTQWLFSINFNKIFQKCWFGRKCNMLFLFIKLENSEIKKTSK